MGVYRGTSLQNLETLATSEDENLEVEVVGGETYHLAIDSTGKLEFRMELVPTAENDAFADRSFFLTNVGSVRGSMVGASVETGEPDHGLSGDVRSVWWSWTAPASGETEINLYSDESSAVVAVYSGKDIGLLERIAGDSTSFYFYAEAGWTYEIAVVDAGSGPDEYSLYIDSPPPPPTLTVSERKIGVLGRTGLPFRLFYSPDLRTWMEVGVDTLQDNFFELHSMESGGEPMGFYLIEPLEFDILP